MVLQKEKTSHHADKYYFRPPLISRVFCFCAAVFLCCWSVLTQQDRLAIYVCFDATNQYEYQYSKSSANQQKISELVLFVCLF